MKDNLIQSISAYAAALEQKISALEQRVALLDEKLASMSAANEEAHALITALQAEVSVLAAASVVTQSVEPEVEIELIVEDTEIEDDSDVSGGILTEESAAELDQLTNTISLEPITDEDDVTTQQVQDDIVDGEVESIEKETKGDIVEQTVDMIEEPVARPIPTQTSLFGPSVDDIRQAISLGDRFLFQRELFGGNGELMQRTLDDINALGTLSEAIEYVNDNFEWDQESTAVQLFENVLKRRFS